MDGPTASNGTALSGAPDATDSRLAAPRDHWRDRWRDPSLTALLVVQCSTIFVLIPGHAAGLPIPEPLSIGLLLAFAALAILMARGRWTLLAGLCILAAMLLNALAQIGVQAGWRHVSHLPVAGELIGMTTFAMLSVVVFNAAFGPGRFSGHRLRGAFVLYLNAALLFAFAHRLLAELIPGAYAHMPPPADRAAFRAATQYFSFSVLTSLGFGDIVPVHPLARSLATLEATVGQLLPVTLIARAVTRAMRTIDDDAP